MYIRTSHTNELLRDKDKIMCWYDMGIISSRIHVTARHEDQRKYEATLEIVIHIAARCRT